MRSYTLHLPFECRPGEAHDLDRAQLVPDGFSGAAFAFSVLWFLYHRLWIAAGLVLAGLCATALIGYGLGLSPVSGTVITVLASLLIGMEASTLRRWTLARNGRPARDAVVAFNADEAEAKAMTRWLDPTRTPAIRPGATFVTGHAEAPVIGLFPVQGGR
ncbi:DUF2628 domain-containing protein [uncultured Methylobacterium sp.]|uniref:DUF2628 domain-containing protein n=1 Tax=uncultured Methylobacterium sp. TaxID=157278 RepID=UPI0035CB376E